MWIFRDASLDPSGVSTPRANVYVESGEWDTKDKLKIKLLGNSCCFGWIGSTSSSISSCGDAGLLVYPGRTAVYD
jgi:hypothetical protein